MELETCTLNGIISEAFGFYIHELFSSFVYAPGSYEFGFDRARQTIMAVICLSSKIAHCTVPVFRRSKGIYPLLLFTA